MKRKTVIILAIVTVLVVGGFFIFRNIRNARNAAAGNYQTAVVERGSLTALVGATGTVRANQSAVLAWQTSGQVASVDVKLDEKVKKDQVLVSLAKGSLPNNVILAEADLVTAQRKLEELKNSNTAAAQAEITLLNAKTALEDAQKNRTSKEYGRASSDTIAAARASYYMAEDKVKKAEDFYDLFSSKPEDDLGRANALTLLVGAKRDRDRALANLNWLVGLPDPEEVTKADAEVKLAEAQVEDAQRALDHYKNGSDPDDIKAAEAQIAALQATIDLARLQAPFAGTVTELHAMAGDEISMGALAVRIDDLTHLLVDVEIPEIDINSIVVGQEARLTFDGIPDQEYTGKVTEVGRVGSAVQGAVNFNVTIELTNADEAVRPGMTAAVNIVVKQLDDVLIVPNRAVRLLNSQRVVYKLVNGIPQAVNITLGATADVNSQILDGDIKEGDTVVLNPPSTFLSNMTQGGFTRGQ